MPGWGIFCTCFPRAAGRRPCWLGDLAYGGSAPVLYNDYIRAVELQSIKNEAINCQDLDKAFSDLILDKSLFHHPGTRRQSARGLFLFGEPGNGKTSIAERISLCYKDSIYIPRSILIDGHIIQFYDPQCHDVIESSASSPFDQRWVKIRRPVVVVGGESDHGVPGDPLQQKATNLRSAATDESQRGRVPH